MTFYLLFYAHEPGMKAELGGVRKVLELARHLNRSGHRALTFAPDFLRIASEPDVPVTGYRTFTGRLLRPLSAYVMMIVAPFRTLRSLRPDVVYARTNRSILPGLFARLIRARFLFEVNGDAYAEQRGRREWLRCVTILLAEWMNCRLAHAVIAITPGLKQMVEQRYGIDPEKVALIPSGTDPVHFTPRETAESRHRLGLSEEGFLIAFVGVLYEHQGVATAIRALPEVRTHCPSTRLLVIGDGPDRARLEVLAESLGVRPAIEFVGAVPYERVPDYVNASDCCVAPFVASRGETSPLKLFDYLACGRPVVASDIPSIRELIKESGAIVPVPPDAPSLLAEALVSLLKDQTRRRQMGDAGRRFIESGYGWKQIALAVVNLAQVSRR
jgi:glycosyltransferase involved in cell wall biosynthesis